MLYIRADGNTGIGMGHVMRCLAVAEAAADRDSLHPPVFITADAGCRAMIEDRGFRVIVLDSDYRDMMGELDRLAAVLQEERDADGAVLLVDSYQVSCEYYRALKELDRKRSVRVACFEDMGGAYPVRTARAEVHGGGERADTGKSAHRRLLYAAAESIPGAGGVRCPRQGDGCHDNDRRQ